MTFQAESNLSLMRQRYLGGITFDPDIGYKKRGKGGQVLDIDSQGQLKRAPSTSLAIREAIPDSDENRTLILPRKGCIIVIT